MNECKKMCSLRENSFNPCIEGVGEDNAKIMFIQDSPDDLDDRNFTPFSGKSCNALRKSISNRGIPLKDVYFTSLVRCVCEDKEIPTPCIAACSQYLEEEIKRVDPEIIVPTGKTLTIKGSGSLTTVGATCARSH